MTFEQWIGNYVEGSSHGFEIMVAGGSAKNTKNINVMMKVVGSSEMSINLHKTLSGP